MPDLIDDLIARAAEARKAAQEARNTVMAARQALEAAEEREEMATRKLYQIIRDRVDTITPRKNGDRTF